MNNYKYIITDRWGYDPPLLFSSEEKILEYFQTLYPEAKSLRILRYDNTDNISVINYTSHLDYGIRHRIHKVKENAK